MSTFLALQRGVHKTTAPFFGNRSFQGPLIKSGLKSLKSTFF